MQWFKFVVIGAVLLMCSGSFADVLFLHHFDQLEGEDLKEKFIADYAAGDPIPANFLTDVNGVRPDIVADQAKFGAGSAFIDVKDGSGRHVNAYLAKGNIDYAQGSVEAWVYLTNVYRGLLFYTRKYGLYESTSTDRLYCTMEGNYYWAMTAYRTGGGSYRIQQPADPNLIVDANTWNYISCDWKLDSDTSTENFVRLWVNGDFVGEVNDIPKMTDIPDANSDLIGIFTRDYETGSIVKGYGDEFRITNELITDLYTVDANNDYTPPTTAFATPALSDCTEVKKYGAKYALTADINGDCSVDFGDIDVVANDWLDCVNPADSNCP